MGTNHGNSFRASGSKVTCIPFLDPVVVGASCIGMPFYHHRICFSRNFFLHYKWFTFTLSLINLLNVNVLITILSEFATHLPHPHLYKAYHISHVFICFHMFKSLLKFILSLIIKQPSGVIFLLQTQNFISIFITQHLRSMLQIRPSIHLWISTSY